METKFLLPNRCKLFGWLILVCSVLFWVYVLFSGEDSEPKFLETSTFTIAGNRFLEDVEYLSIIDVNITFTLIGVLFIIGGLLVVFSREKIEDEFISKLRLISFQRSFLINYTLLLFLFLFVFGYAFFNVMIYNMFTTLIFFIIQFHYLLFKYKNLEHEK